MTTRRDFIRQGALFVAAGALIEPKRLWAFPTNPLGPQGRGWCEVRTYRATKRGWPVVWGEVSTRTGSRVIVPFKGGIAQVRPTEWERPTGAVLTSLFRGEGDRFTGAPVCGWDEVHARLTPH